MPRLAIVEKQNEGVNVSGIIEQINTQGSEYEYLLDEGVNVMSHQGFGDSFHHKYCIIDHANTDSDPLVITGSHNWSGVAETNNDENTMIIHDANIVNQFYQEFQARVNELENQVEPSYNCVGKACIDPMDGSGTYSSLVACEFVCTFTSIDKLKTQEIQLYPNPNNSSFTLQVVGLESANIQYKIVDIQGKTIVTDFATVTNGLNKIEMKKNLKAGLYFIEIADERIKFIVQ